MNKKEPLYTTSVYEGCEDRTITTYLPEGDNKTDIAVVIFPGGAYAMLAEHEGKNVAEMYNQNGITAFVVEYTLVPNCHEINPLTDAAKAMIYAREHADEYGFDKNKIAVCGFSAGGHLAAYISTCWADERVTSRLGIGKDDARPNGSILCYPVISAFDMPHHGSIYNLLSNENPSKEELERVSLEKRVTDQTPSAYIWSTSNDDAVPIVNSLDYAASLGRHGITFEIHIFPKGPHGMGLANEHFPWDTDGKCRNDYIANWGSESVHWLKTTFHN